MMTTKERLHRRARLLESVDARRLAAQNPHIFSSVERQIVNSELAELADEWRRSLEVDQTKGEANHVARTEQDADHRLPWP